MIETAATYLLTFHLLTAIGKVQGSASETYDNLNECSVAYATLVKQMDPIAIYPESGCIAISD